LKAALARLGQAENISSAKLAVPTSGELRLNKSRGDAMDFDKWAPTMLSIMRIVAGLIFLEHGTQKLFGFPAPPQGGLPPAMSLLWYAAIIEIICSPFLVVGLFTRLAAFLLSGEMAIAYWYAHFPRNIYPLLNGGDAAILYCFVFLYIAVAGGGAIALDNLFGGKKN
jgi:putative oxidoreductase